MSNSFLEVFFIIPTERFAVSGKSMLITLESYHSSQKTACSHLVRVEGFRKAKEGSHRLKMFLIKESKITSVLSCLDDCLFLFQLIGSEILSNSYLAC